jgi:hypothetical protein
VKTASHKEGENFEMRISYPAVKKPNWGGEGRIVRAIMADYRQQRDGQVCYHGKHHPPNHSAEDETIGIEEINDETDKEKEEGNE